MPYDLFVSYSRKDNQQGRVTELVERIQLDYREFANEELQCFFDVSEIKAMDDWRHRILGGLRESNLLLLVLSPAYLASPYCEWEIVEFLKYENSRAVQGQGVAQIYFVNIAGLDEPGFDARSAAWVARVRRRNYVDLRPWYDEGAAALRQADVRTRFEELNGSLAGRLTRLRRIAQAPGNLPAHNPRFVGRETEMERLHTTTGFGQFGVLTAVQGVGGMGKTALAIQYAYAYADFYPGGRWMIGCAGRPSLAPALRTLDSALDIQFTDDEKIDDTRAATRVLAVLQQRAESGAAARAGEKNPPAPRALLILDNIDDPTLLQPPHIDLLSGRTWLHVIATTRLDPERIGPDGARYRHLPVDELPEDDALRLIESWQPQGRFPDEAERDAAREIVRLLSGFTLAVEVVAVHLGERSGRRATGLLQRLKREGVDDIGLQTTTGVIHVEKLLSRTLAPTLETLNAEETRALTAAALLPPDSVPLPWLRSVVAEAHSEIGRDAEPGYDDPWLTVVNHLVGLRLLQVVGWADDGRTPRICRMHRLIQSAARARKANQSIFPSRGVIYNFIRTVTGGRAGSVLAGIETSLMKLAKVRTHFLKEGWVDRTNRWEIYSLSAFAAHLLDTNVREAAWLADQAATLLSNLGDYRGAEPLCQRALETRKRVMGPAHPTTLASMNNLAGLLANNGDYLGAVSLARRALEASEHVLGPKHLNTLCCVNSLAHSLELNGDYSNAEPLYRRALEGIEGVLGPDHRTTLVSVNNLALILWRNGDLVSAEPLHRRVLETRERLLGLEHPDTLVSVNNLALVLQSKGDYVSAELLFRRVLAGLERVLNPDHPFTLGSMNNLAGLLARKGDCGGAEQLYLRALEGSERELGSRHPHTLELVRHLTVLRAPKNEGEEPRRDRGGS